jgi:electron transfer flavoprotein alpha subunit
VILVIAEQRDGRLNRASWEAIAAAQQLAAGGPLRLGLIGSGVDAAAQELAGAGDVFVAADATLATYTPDGFAVAAKALLEAAAPQLVMLAHTYQARDFAPLLAARMNLPLITDVTAVSGPAEAATFTRPMFQGKLAAQVKPVGASPAVVTIQIGAFRADSVTKGTAGQVTPVSVSIDGAAIRQRPEAPFQEAKAAVDLSQAQRIVAVGRGIKSQENLAVAQSLATALGAEIAASRPICDNGWLPMERQIGSSGQTVAPKLYVALGISGAIQHLVGMKGSRTIVAINKDAEAPIFEVADYGIVGDLFEVAPAIVAELKKG